MQFSRGAPKCPEEFSVLPPGQFTNGINSDDATVMKTNGARAEACVEGASAGTEEDPRSDERDRRSSLDRRRGPGRRRTDYRRDAEEGHMNEEQLDFIKAIDEYKRVNNRPFPTCTEILDLLLFLGYRKVAPVGEFKLSKGRQQANSNE